MADTSFAVGRLLAADDSPPDMTVVIPTYNRCERLLQVLRKLDKQKTTTSTGHEFTFEVIVVSDGSTDGTAERLADFSSSLRLRVIEQENGGPAKARNVGICAAAAKIVVFLDDDVLPEPHCLAAHMRAHIAHDELVVVGPMLTPLNVNLKPWIQWEQHQLEKQYDRLRDGESLYPRQFYTGNASAKRCALIEAGLFDSTLRRSEDVEMGQRLSRIGQSFAFVEEAEAYHLADRSFDSWSKVAYDYGRNDVQFSATDITVGLADISRFFAERNPAQRLLIRALLPGTRRHRVGRNVLTGAAAMAHTARATGLTRVLLSAVYGLHYYRGVADELGSTQELRALLTQEVGSEDAPSSSEHVVPWMVLEQTLGHVTHGKNLRKLLPNVRGAEPVFLPVEFDVSGPARRLPIWSNWTVRAGVRARQQLRSRLRTRSVPRPDVLFVHSQVPAVLLGRWLKKTPTIVSLDATPRQYDELGEFYNHVPGSPKLERFKDLANRRCFERAAHLVTWSEWAKQGLVDGYGITPDKVTVISPGVDTEMWGRPESEPRSGPLRILFVGGNLERKGGDHLLDACRKLREEPEVPEFELHLVTPTQLDPEPRVVMHNGLTPNSPDLIRQYHRADIFCLPTRGDCLPMVLAEAGAAGLPVVSTNVAAIPSIVQHEKTGLLVQRGNLDELTDALRRLLVDPELRAELGKSARVLVETEHNAARNAAALVDVFRMVRESSQH